MALQDENIPPLSHTAAAMKIDGSAAATAATTNSIASNAASNTVSNNLQTKNSMNSVVDATSSSILHGVTHLPNRQPFSNHSHSISNQEHFSSAAIGTGSTSTSTSTSAGAAPATSTGTGTGTAASAAASQTDISNAGSRHLRAVSGVSMLSPFQSRRRVEVHDENNETVNETTANDLVINENENNETLTDLNNPIMVSDETRRMSLKRRPPTDLQDDHKRVRLEDSVLHTNENEIINNCNQKTYRNKDPHANNHVELVSDSSEEEHEEHEEQQQKQKQQQQQEEKQEYFRAQSQQQQHGVRSAHDERVASLCELKYDNLDLEDADDPLMVSEYVEDIFKYLYETEAKMLPDPNYLQMRTELRPKMRSILVDWMVEVHLKFKLLPETLYLAINIMDRFLSKEVVQVDRLQLLATGSLFIAAKYEEVYSPSIKNYAYVTDGAFTEEEILGAEKFILEILNFNMAYPNPLNFLRRISKADDYNVHTRTIAKYLLEITIVDHRFIGYLPSLCAAAAMYIARKMIGKNDWNPNLIHYSGDYTKKHLAPVCEMIMDYLQSPVVHEEFFRKYASRRFLKVSILARTWARESVRSMSSIMN